jgi:hypothetical protein
MRAGYSGIELSPSEDERVHVLPDDNPYRVQIDERKKEILELDSRRSRQVDEIDKLLFAIAMAGIGIQASTFRVVSSWGFWDYARGISGVVDIIVFLGVVVSYLFLMQANQRFYEAQRDKAMDEIRGWDPTVSYEELPSTLDVNQEYEASLVGMKKWDGWIRRFFWWGLVLFGISIVMKLF